MSNWPATKARRVPAALERIGWRVERQSGSHKLLTREGWPGYEFSFHDNAELGIGAKSYRTRSTRSNSVTSCRMASAPLRW